MRDVKRASERYASSPHQVPMKGWCLRCCGIIRSIILREERRSEEVKEKGVNTNVNARRKTCECEMREAVFCWKTAYCENSHLALARFDYYICGRISDGFWFSVAVVLSLWFTYNYTCNYLYFIGRLLTTIKIAAMVTHCRYLLETLLKFQPQKQEDCPTVVCGINNLRPNRIRAYREPRHRWQSLRRLCLMLWGLQ